MYSKFVHAFYYFNIIVQSVFSLLCPVGLLTLLAWYLSSRAIVGEWIYAPLILFGIGAGVYSMMRFVTSATAQVRALESAEQEKQKSGTQKTKSQSKEEGE